MIDQEVRARAAEQQRIADEVDRFLRNGGKIQFLPQHEVSSNKGGFGYNNSKRGYEDGQ